MFKHIVLAFVGTLVLLGALGFSVALAAHPASQGEPPVADPQQAMEEGVDWFAVAAGAIGLDTDALWTNLEDGQSIAQVAQAQGVEPQKVIDAVVAAEQVFLAQDARSFVEESWDEWADCEDCAGVDWFTVAADALGLDEDVLWERLDGEQSLAEIAQAQGVDTQKVVDAIVAAEKESVAQLVAEGELTQEEADEWLADLDEEARSFVEESWDEWEGVDWFAVAADALGLDTDALWEKLDGGQSLAEIAQAQGVDTQKVVDAIVAAEKEWVAGQVADGNFTQEEADEWLTDLDEGVRSFVEETFEDIMVEQAP